MLGGDIGWIAGGDCDAVSSQAIVVCIWTPNHSTNWRPKRRWAARFARYGLLSRRGKLDRGGRL